jgi:hypothetical protein
VSAIKQAEQTLRQSEEQLASQVNDLETLRQLSIRVAATSDCTAALEDVLQTAMALVGAAKGNVQIYDLVEGGLKIIAHRGFNDEFLEHFKVVPLGYSCCGAAMERRERVIIEDVFADPRFRDFGEVYARHGFLAVQSTPLLASDGELLGMFRRTSLDRSVPASAICIFSTRSRSTRGESSSALVPMPPSASAKFGWTGSARRWSPQ